MVRRRRRRSPDRALGRLKDGFSSAAMETLESRCLFNMEPVFSPPIIVESTGSQGAAFVADGRGERPLAGAEMFGRDHQTDAPVFDGYAFGELASQPLFVEHDFGFAPLWYSRLIIVEIQPSGGSDSEASPAAEQAPATSPAANLQSSVTISITSNAGEAGASRAASTSVWSGYATANSGYSNELASFDFEAPDVKALNDLTLEAVRAARPDANDPGRIAPAGLAVRATSTPTITSETDRHANNFYSQSSAVYYASAPVLGKQAGEAPARLDGEELLRAPMTQVAKPETVERVFGGALAGLRAVIEEPVEAAVAIRPALALATEVQGRLFEASSEFFDAEISWTLAAPLLPQFSPDAAELGQAFDAVLADLDELGGELMSSLAAGDRLLWGAGACGVVSYVAARHFHLRAAPQSPALRRSRESRRTALRRTRLAFQPLVK